MRRAAATAVGAVIGAAAISGVLVGSVMTNPEASRVRLNPGVATLLTGSVTGVAAPCRGIGEAPITVYASHNGRTVAFQEVPPVKGGGHYLLRLAVSSYLISAPGSAFPPQLIYVHAGETLTVNFPDDCM
jgi:hypothetical protein